MSGSITATIGTSAAVATQQVVIATAAAQQGPAGPPGASAAVPTIYPISGASSFTASHGLSFAPEAWLVTPAGELVEADVMHAAGATTVVFPQPFTGTLYLR